MKISILNHCYFTPEHIEQLKEMGEVVEYPNTTSASDAVSNIGDAEIAIGDCFEFPMNKEFFDTAKSLKFLSLNTTGFDIVDIGAAKERGIKISNLPGFSTEAVAEHALAMMFGLSKKLIIGNEIMHIKPFQLNPANRAHDEYIGMSLRGKTVGVIGLGKIGSRIAELGNGIGMKVIGYNRTPKQLPNVTGVEIDGLIKSSDVIVLAMAFNEDLRNFIDKDAISKMRKSVIIINVGRGEFINEKDLIEALDEDRIAGFGADVIADWSVNNPLFKCKNVILTPHFAFLTDESLKNMADIIVSNVRLARTPKVAC